MMSVVLGTLLPVAIFAAPIEPPPPTILTRYAQWASAYNRTQDPSRALIFAKNLEFIKSHDSSSLGFEVQLNQFADLTLAEFRALAIRRPPAARASTVDFQGAADESVDWRAKDKVLPVHDLGMMGCSVPDVMVDVLSSAEAIQCKAPLETFSYEQLYECGDGPLGCAGSMDQFEQYVEKHGLMTSAAYTQLPGSSGTCRVNSTVVSDLPCPVHKWTKVTKDDSDALKAAVSSGPVLVLVNAASADFQFYKSGVFQGACDPQALDHAMVVVGYDKDEASGKEFWIVKNDWGTTWGDAGYISIARTSGKGPGTCGIASAASFPTLKAPHQ